MHGEGLSQPGVARAACCPGAKRRRRTAQWMRNPLNRHNNLCLQVQFHRIAWPQPWVVMRCSSYKGGQNRKRCPPGKTDLSFRWAGQNPCPPCSGFRL